MFEIRQLNVRVKPTSHLEAAVIAQLKEGSGRGEKRQEEGGGARERKEREVRWKREKKSERKQKETAARKGERVRSDGSIYNLVRISGNISEHARTQAHRSTTAKLLAISANAESNICCQRWLQLVSRAVSVSVSQVYLEYISHGSPKTSFTSL